MVRLLPGVVGEVVEVGQHLRRPVLGPLQGPVVEYIKVVKKEVKKKNSSQISKKHRKCNNARLKKLFILKLLDIKRSNP